MSEGFLDGCSEGCPEGWSDVWSVTPIVHALALRRISKHLARMEQRGPPAVKQAIAHGVITSSWRHYIEATLSLLWPASSHPYPSTVVKASERLVYTPLLQPYMADDVRSHSCRNRITSTYVQQVWDGKFGVPHPVHLTTTIPCRDYRWWMRVRTLTFPAPAYTHHFSASGLALCNLGCVDSHGDLMHYVSECPHARIASPSPCLLVQQLGLFCPNLDPHTAAQLASKLCTLLKDGSRTTPTQPQPHALTLET